MKRILLALLLVGCGRSEAQTSDPAAKKGPPAGGPVSGPAGSAGSAAKPAEPDAITHSSQTADGKPGVASTKHLQVKDPLRGTHAEDAPVGVALGGTPAELIERALKSADAKIPTDRPVIIKVNLGGFDSMHPGKADNGLTGRITSPEFVRALVGVLRARGVKQIAIADGQSSPQKDWKKLLELSGYAKLAEELKVEIVDLNDYAGDTGWHIAADWFKNLKPDELVLSDRLVNPKNPIFLIDAPHVKMHRFAVASLSIKNLMGTVMMSDADAKAPPFMRRYRMHRELQPWLTAWQKKKQDDREVYKASLVAFSQRLADLYGVVTPDLVIEEGIPAAAGDGFQKIVPFGEDLVVASRNGCYADYVVADWLGIADSAELEKEIGARMPPAIAAVAERYYGGVAHLAKIDVRGDVAWRKDPKRKRAYFKAMAPFELNAP